MCCTILFYILWPPVQSLSIKFYKKKLPFASLNLYRFVQIASFFCILSRGICSNPNSIHLWSCEFFQERNIFPFSFLSLEIQLLSGVKHRTRNSNITLSHYMQNCIAKKFFRSPSRRFLRPTVTLDCLQREEVPLSKHRSVVPIRSFDATILFIRR